MHRATQGLTVSMGLGLAALALPATAQSSAQATPQAAPQSTPAAKPRSIDTAPVCMQGKLRSVAQVPAERRGKPLDLVVARTDVAALEASGFVVVDCNASGLARVERRAAWRDEICALAAYGNEAVQNQLAAALGARPANLCGSAELVAGAWKRPAK